MIPHRMLSNDFRGSGLKTRVTACRKRLRENRVMLKAHTTTVVEELFSEARINCSAQGAERTADGMLGQIEEPEVGIT